MSQSTRWTRRNRRIDTFSRCKICGTCWGGEGQRCAPTTCPACGSTVCMGHGLGNGKCPICMFGLLPGWSGNRRVCTYKHCGQPAIARHPSRRPWYVCKAHWERAGGAFTVEIALSRRPHDWELVDDEGQAVRN